MKLRQIHPFGPAVGEYVPGAETDIRRTFERQRQRLRVVEPDYRKPADRAVVLTLDGAVFA